MDIETPMGRGRVFVLRVDRDRVVLGFQWPLDYEIWRTELLCANMTKT